MVRKQPTPKPAVRVPVLMYHRVGTAQVRSERRYCVAPKLFRAQMAALADRGMAACSLGTFLDWIDGKATLDAGAFLITFDDGYHGVFEYAFPILSEFRWPAAVFLVSDRVGLSSDWSSDKRVAPREFALLGRAEILEMQRAGVAFHSHTLSHADLTAIGRDEAMKELHKSRTDLMRLLDVPVNALAYPYGRYDEMIVALARAAGYRAAFAVAPGFNQQGTDPYRIRRIDVYGTDTPSRLRRKVTFGTNDGSIATSLRYFGERLRRAVGERIPSANRTER